MAKHPSTIPAPSRTDALTNAVLEGMRKHPRQLSPVWFYDELGSFLFDSICELPEYYLTRTELQIMQQYAADMAHHIGPDAAIIEFGSGTSTKTRLLLNHLEKPAAYVPVDIARDHLLEAASAISRDTSICLRRSTPGADVSCTSPARRSATSISRRLTACCRACATSSART